MSAPTFPPVTRLTFETVVNEESRPTLVDFWAPWCGSCKLFAPAVATVSSELQSRMDVVAVDTSTDADLAEHLDVMSLPTLILFVSGQEVARISGPRSARKLRSELEALLPSGASI